MVGAGSSGAALAARLSEQPDRRVLLVEAGPDRSGGTSTRSDPDRLPADRDDRVRGTRVELGTGGPPARLLQGRGVGGSSAVNGAYFVRPTRSDVDRWAGVAGERWTWDAVLPAMRRLEADADLGPSMLHGGDGPMPVRRVGEPLHPVTAAFLDACAASGHPEHADLNDGGDRGWGVVPRNVDGRGRVDVAAAYLTPALARPNLELRSGWRVEVDVDRGRAVGVHTASAAGPEQTARARTVVLCAGALASPRLLDRALGVDGGGRRLALHPVVDLPFTPVDGVDPDGPLLQGVLHEVLPSGGVVEILATCRPYGRATGAAPHDTTLSLRVSLMTGRRTARLHHGSGGRWVEHRWSDWDPADRADLRAGVRSATAIAASASFARIVGAWHGPPAEVSAADSSLDRWISERLVVSMHAAGSVAMRRRGEPGTVDELGAVRGVDGLRIADLSILPTLPSRGPACTAVVLAEHLAPTFA